MLTGAEGEARWREWGPGSGSLQCCIRSLCLDTLDGEQQRQRSTHPATRCASARLTVRESARPIAVDSLAIRSPYVVDSASEQVQHHDFTRPKARAELQGRHGFPKCQVLQQLRGPFAYDRSQISKDYCAANSEPFFSKTKKTRNHGRPVLFLFVFPFLYDES